MRFTVLTPTFNRANILPRVYESLRAQTFRDFEWLIVDDGSTDGTRGLVESWNTWFPIRYFWKANGGQHTAINLGVREARGELTAILDDDDYCLPHALERIDYHWSRIPQPERFAGVIGLCYREDGKTLLGSEFPQAYVDTYTLRDSRRLTPVDRWGAMRTDLLRRFPYPVFPGERICDLGIIQNRIIRRYAMRYFNEPVQVHYYLADGITRRGDHRWSNPRGALVFHWELFLADLRFGSRLKALLNVLRFAPLAAFARLRRPSGSDGLT